MLVIEKYAWNTVHFGSCGCLALHVLLQILPPDGAIKLMYLTYIILLLFITSFPSQLQHSQFWLILDNLKAGMLVPMLIWRNVFILKVTPLASLNKCRWWLGVCVCGTGLSNSRPAGRMRHALATTTPGLAKRKKLPIRHVTLPWQREFDAPGVECQKSHNGSHNRTKPCRLLI